MAIRLIRDIYPLIIILLDPPSQAMFAFSCKSFLRLGIPEETKGLDYVINQRNMVISQY